MKKLILLCFAFFSVMTFSMMLFASPILVNGGIGPVLPIPQASDLTDEQLLEIGIKIWQNQCGVWNCPGKITHEMKDGITSWEAHYALIGIGQCIWYPADETKNFQEDWPRVAQALKEKGYPIEDWMLEACPWKNNKEFFADFDEDRLKSLRKMLVKKALIIEQARCIAMRLDESLKNMTDAVDAETNITKAEKGDLKNIIIGNFYQVSTADYPRGLYAMMDYVHFKGEGVLATEVTSEGLHFGLRQALEQMDLRTVNKVGAIPAFVEATINMIPSRKDNQYFKNRMETYMTFNPDELK